MGAWPGSGRGGEAVAGAAHRLQASGPATEFAADGADHDLDDVEHFPRSEVGQPAVDGGRFQCTPAALAQPGGAQAGPAAVRQLADDAGFSRFRQVTQTPVNVVLELRP